MKKIILFLEMLFIYPSIFFNAFGVRNSDFEQKYASFKWWTKYYLKLLGIKTELKHVNLIPLEDGFLFVISHESDIDSLILVDALPVKTNFLLDQKESIPYMNVWYQSLRSIRFDRTSNDYGALNEPFNLAMKACDNLCVFRNSLGGVGLPPAFLELAYQSEKTLIPVKIKGSKTAVAKGGSHRISVDIGLPLHYEEYGSSSYDQCLVELNQRIDSL